MPGTRVSGGKYLEILAAAPAVGLPLEIDIYDGANPATMMATMEAAYDAALQVELSEVGSGRFMLLRSDPKATAALLAKGNLVKVKTGGLYRGSWWIEEPVETLTSSREASGESWDIKGRGALAYLERGTVYPPVWPIVPLGFRSASSGVNIDAGANTVVCNKPAGMVSGDTMVAAVAFAGGSDKVITPPLGWTAIERADEGTDIGVALFVKSVGSTEPASYSWPFTTVTRAVVNIVALSNASPDYTQYSIATSTLGSGTAILQPSLSVGLVDGALVTFAASTVGSGMTPPAGYTEAADNSGSTLRKLESAWRMGPVLGDTGDVTTTNSSSGPWVGIHIYLPSAAVNDATFAGETPGAILSTLIDRAQARGVMLSLTYDFSATVDSQGQPWADTFDLTFHAGSSLLDVWRNLVALGMEGEMSHDLILSTYVERSRDKAATVILRKGYHFLGDVANIGHFAGLRTRFLVEGAGGRLVEVTNPALEALPLVGRREGFLSMSTSDSPTDLARAGEQALALSALEDAARSIPVDHGVAANGRYEPWDDYRLGDYIGLDAAGTGVVTSERVVGITVGHRDSLDYSVELDLNSVSLEASVRMRRQIDALARSSSGTSSGLTMGGGASPGGGSGAAGLVSVQLGDTVGYLFDKINVGAPLRKTVGGVVGNRAVALDIGTGTKNGTKFLRDDGVWTTIAGLSPSIVDGVQRAFVDPTGLAWSWVNQGTAAIAVQGAALYLSHPAVAADAVHYRMKTVPSKPYTIIAHWVPSLPGKDNAGCTIGWLDAADKAYHALLISITGLPALLAEQSGTPYLMGTAENIRITGFDAYKWIKLTDSVTVRTISISRDGTNWLLLWSEATNTFLTPNRVGFGLSSRNATMPAGLLIDSWEEA